MDTLVFISPTSNLSNLTIPLWKIQIYKDLGGIVAVIHPKSVY